MAGSARKFKEDILEDSLKVGTCEDIQVSCDKLPPMPPKNINRNNTKSALRRKKSYGIRISLSCNEPLKKVLMVYTKRLDDMEIVLNPLPVKNPANFFEKILAESKPQINHNLFKYRMPSDKKEDGPMSYVKLKYKIDRANKTIGRKMLQIKQKQAVEIKATHSETDYDNLLTKQVSAVNESKKRKTYAKKKSKSMVVCIKDIKTRMQYLVYHNNYLILKNIKTNEADVYFLNYKGIITQHYHTDNEKHNFFQRSIKTAELPYCCWYQRQDFVRLISLYLPPISIKYMDISHSCEGQCTCCCPHLIKKVTFKAKKSEEFITEKTVTIPDPEEINAGTGETIPHPEQINAGTGEVNSEIIVTLIAPKVLIENMLNKPPNVYPISSLIQKAFAFTLPEKTRQKTHSVNNKDVKETHILLNYKDGNEYYKIGLEGEISQHLRNVSHIFIEEYVVGGENTINEAICCWFSREKVINSLRKNKMLPNTLKYMRTRHTCFVDTCVCCCVPFKLTRRKTNHNFKKVKFPAIPNYTTEVCTELPPLKFAFATFEPASYDDLVPICGFLPHDNQTVKNPPIQSTVNDDSENVNNQVDKNEEERRKLICANATLLLGSKMKKLKNASVHINENAKITAVLNIPVTELSNDELRILSCILSQAQNDIDASKQVSSTNILNNHINPNSNNTNVAFPTSFNSEITSNKTDQKVQKKQSNNPLRTHLYAAFANWSSIHTYEYLKSFKVFSSRKKSIFKKPQQGTRELFRAKSTDNRRKRVIIETNEGQTQSVETLQTTKKRRTAKRKTVETLKIIRKSISSADPLNVSSLPTIATNSFISESNLSIPATESHANSLELEPIYVISDDNESLEAELLSPSNNEACTAHMDDPDCILGA